MLEFFKKQDKYEIDFTDIKGFHTWKCLASSEDEAIKSLRKNHKYISIHTTRKIIKSKV